MKYIQLGGKDKELKTMVDDEDYEKFSSRKWRLAGKGYVSRTNYIGERGRRGYKREMTYLHRLIMSCPSGMFVDHINNDRLDNRKTNLRICSNSQNNARKLRLDPDKNLPYIGVYKYKNDSSYRFQVKCGDICINGRGYKTEEEAEKHYQFMHKLLFQEYSNYLP